MPFSCFFFWALWEKKTCVENCVWHVTVRRYATYCLATTAHVETPLSLSPLIYQKTTCGGHQPWGDTMIVLCGVAGPISGGYG